MEAAQGSFDGVVEAIEAATGQHLGKRQVEELAARAAVDFEAFYAQAPRPQARPTDVVVLSADGKGIVMRPGALRPATAKAAAAAVPKLATRLSKGEKANRKRMATVGAVYDLTPVPRTAADILDRGGGTSTPPTPAPVAKDKWLMASVEANAAANRRRFRPCARVPVERVSPLSLVEDPGDDGRQHRRRFHPAQGHVLSPRRSSGHR